MDLRRNGVIDEFYLQMTDKFDSETHLNPRIGVACVSFSCPLSQYRAYLHARIKFNFTCKIFKREHKHIFTFYVIPPH